MAATGEYSSQWYLPNTINGGWAPSPWITTTTSGTNQITFPPYYQPLSPLTKPEDPFKEIKEAVLVAHMERLEERIKELEKRLGVDS